jgi:hypothetical protein
LTIVGLRVLVHFFDPESAAAAIARYLVESVELHKKEALPPFFSCSPPATGRPLDAPSRAAVRARTDPARRTAIALFQRDRLTSFRAEAMQRELDSVVRESSALGLSACFFQSHKRAILEKEVQPFGIRGKRHQDPDPAVTRKVLALADRPR